MKLSDAPDDKLIAGYVKIRDSRAQRKAAFDADDADDKGKQEKIEIEFLRRFSERGTDSSTSRGVGTAYRLTKTSCTMADWDIFFPFVQANDMWEMIERRPSKDAVKAYREIHNDLPPGLNWREELAVGFRRG